MTKQYLVVVRHGQSFANLHLQELPPEALYYSTSGSDPEVGLTPYGMEQGSAVGELLAELFPGQAPLDVIYHAEFLRICQMVEKIEAKLPYKPRRVCDKRLNKRSYGRFWNLTRKGVSQLHPDEYARYLQEGDLQYRAPDGGENYPDLFARADEFMAKLPAGNILAVTHSAPALAIRRHIEGLPDREVLRQYEEQALANGAVIVYAREPGRPWSLVCEHSVS